MRPDIEPLPSSIATLRLLIEYDGTDYVGWQRQPRGRTVQAEIEDALAVALRQPTPIMGSGRTDAGVHARGQVAHARVPAGTDPFRVRGNLNGLLPPSIAILDADLAPGPFHARYDARRRTYHYHVSTAPRAVDRTHRVALRQPVDFGAMNREAEALLGRHEFSSFCRTKSETTNRVCCVEHAVWLAEERPGDWRFEIAADRFLHGMVRAVAGTLLEVGRGFRQPGAVSRILGAHDRREAGAAAPAHGLVLHRVAYDAPLFASGTA